MSSAMIILHKAIRTSCAFVRVRSGRLADVRMRVFHQSNGGSNISKREINKLWRDFFSQSCTCFAWGAADSNKLCFYLSIRVKIM